MSTVSDEVRGGKNNSCGGSITSTCSLGRTKRWIFKYQIDIIIKSNYLPVISFEACFGSTGMFLWRIAGPGIFL